MARHLRLAAYGAVFAAIVASDFTIQGRTGQRGVGTPPGQIPAPPPNGPPPAIEKPGIVTSTTHSPAGWSDLETWTYDVGLAPDKELGLGLLLSGPAGRVSAGFTILRLRNAPTAPPNQVIVTLFPAFDPNRIRWTNASFTVTKKNKEKEQVTIDMSGRIATFPPGPFGPGDGPQNARATLTTKEFEVIADGLEVTGSLLNTRVVFREDQLRALRSFGQRVGLIGR